MVPISELVAPPHARLGDSVRSQTTRFATDDLEGATNHYLEHGYVVVSGVVDQATCSRVNDEFDRVVRPYDSYLYRQTTCNPEIHRFDAAGHMMNPLLNVQDLPSGRFGSFRTAALDAITNDNTIAFVNHLFSEPARVVQSMYFEGNPATWAHQDTYYLDSEHLGTMVAAWIATEDIAEGAGRFYVYPTSHQVDMFLNGGQFDVAFNHDRYKRLVEDTIRDRSLECLAPALQAGDVLYWNSKTIHGSLATERPEASRRSLTAHFIPKSQRFLQHQSRIRPLSITSHRGVDVHSPKSLDNRGRRAVLKVETTFPSAFKTAKRVATKASITIHNLKPATKAAP